MRFVLGGFAPVRLSQLKAQLATLPPRIDPDGRIDGARSVQPLQCLLFLKLPRAEDLADCDVGSGQKRRFG